MKLRDKRTGEVKELRAIFLVKTVRETSTTTSDHVERFYYTIADLNAEWEDYEPAEPLIKDEQVRKAVRAWAEANAPTTRLKFDEDNARLSSETSCIEFDDYQPFSRLKDDEEYTIAALCGEDEDEA